uniref:Uncharacterized protein n=1 Tax=Arundo donax TaxID=35708 RepID=A0A0A9HI65_ARUDO
MYKWSMKRENQKFRESC